MFYYAFLEAFEVKTDKLAGVIVDLRHFPLMRRAREYFGLGIVNDFVFAVGGDGTWTNMEKINYKTDSEWTLTDLPFTVSHHCLTTTTSSLVIIGGWYNGKVSKMTFY